MKESFIEELEDSINNLDQEVSMELLELKIKENADKILRKKYVKKVTKC